MPDRLDGALAGLLRRLRLGLGSGLPGATCKQRGSFSTSGMAKRIGEVGLEPTWGRPRQILSLLCLPFHHSPAIREPEPAAACCLCLQRAEPARGRRARGGRDCASLYQMGRPPVNRRAPFVSHRASERLRLSLAPNVAACAFASRWASFRTGEPHKVRWRRSSLFSSSSRVIGFSWLATNASTSLSSRSIWASSSSLCA